MLAEDRDRLEKLDKLYALRLNRCVSLRMVPCCTSLANNADQLTIVVVVGDKSSGKSSVLEVLTGLPFPRDSSLCTRFPTQVVFKRSAVKQTEVSIMPTESQTEHQSPGVDKFRQRFDQCRFVGILSEARSLDWPRMI